jgi:hypothetical protein
MPLTYRAYAGLGFCHRRGYRPEDTRDGLRSVPNNSIQFNSGSELN